MDRIPYSTIEQWSVLRAVIEEGGYARAADALHRSQSSVSYAISQLQKALDVKLLTIEGRRAVLTDVGRTLLTEAMPLIDEFRHLEDRTRSIAQGEPASIRLVVDYLYPKARLYDALGRFSDQHPTVDLHLREVVRRPIGSLRDDSFDIAVLINSASAQWSELLADIPMITVAHAGHPLAAAVAPIPPTMLRRYPRIVLQGYEEGGETVVEEGKIWRMNTVESAIAVIRRGIGFSRLPRHEIEMDLDAGTMVPIDIGRESRRTIPLGLSFPSTVRHVHPTTQTLARLLGAKLDGR